MVLSLNFHIQLFVKCFLLIEHECELSLCSCMTVKLETFKKITCYILMLFFLMSRFLRGGVTSFLPFKKTILIQNSKKDFCISKKIALKLKCSLQPYYWCFMQSNVHMRKESNNSSFDYKTIKHSEKSLLHSCIYIYANSCCCIYISSRYTQKNFVIHSSQLLPLLHV